MIFYRPEHSVAADIIPFYHNGRFQLYYLRDYRNPEVMGEGVPWDLLETTDFVNYEDFGEVISRGTKEEQDLAIFTGSVFEKDGKGYIFYTGHNHHFIEAGKPQEAICLCTSDDFHHWTKVPEFRLYPPECFEPHDFRDPFVFWNPETEEYNMLLAARLRDGAPRRRGVTALAVSKDLLNWEVKEEPFYAPNFFFTHECPDLFQIGDWWYLVFSEFTEKCITRYRMAKSPCGPWLTPKVDTFDCRGIYAAKSASDGKHRYLFGWNPTRIDDTDYKMCMWGGNIIVHEIHQQPDGTLTVDVPETVKAQFKTPVPVTPFDASGTVGQEDGVYTIGDLYGYSSLTLGELKDPTSLEMEFALSEDVREFMVFLRSDAENESRYYLKFDPVLGRMVFDSWPRPEADQWFMLNTERPAVLKPNEKNHLLILIEGSVIEVYLNHQVALSCRMYDLTSGTYGIASVAGAVKVENIQQKAL